MNQNMGKIDRGLRLAVAVLIALLLAFGQLGGVLAVVLGVVAVAFLVTGLMGWCPAYLPFGISTMDQPPAESSVSMDDEAAKEHSEHHGHPAK